MKKLLRSVVVLAAMAMMTMGMATAVSAVEAKVNIPESIYYNDKPTIRSYSWNQSNELGNYDQGVIVPIYVPKTGVVYVDAGNISFEAEGHIAVFSDQACTQTTNLYASINKTDKTFSDFFYAKKAGTYYLKIWSITYAETYRNSLSVALELVSNTEKNIVAGKNYLFTATSFSDILYFKYKAPSTGYIAVDTLSSVGDLNSPYVTLTNAKKKDITKSSLMRKSINYEKVYAVQKGKTYYIKLSNASSGKLNVVTITHKKIKEKSGKKRAKAVAIKAKKKARGTMQIGEKADWYKITLKKKKALTITVSNYSDYEEGGLKISLYDSKGKIIGYSRTINRGKNQFAVTYGSTYKKANKGKYYLKIERTSKKSSGYYEVQWK